MTRFRDTLSRHATLRSGVAAAAFVALLGGATPCAAEPIQKRAQMQVSVAVHSVCTVTPSTTQTDMSLAVTCRSNDGPEPIIEKSDVMLIETEQGPTSVIITSVMF
jgi:hypothetical protein